jgi:hypothetical protein
MATVIPTTTYACESFPYVDGREKLWFWCGITEGSDLVPDVRPRDSVCLRSDDAMRRQVRDPRRRWQNHEAPSDLAQERIRVL